MYCRKSGATLCGKIQKHTCEDLWETPVTAAHARAEGLLESERPDYTNYGCFSSQSFWKTGSARNGSQIADQLLLVRSDLLRT
jgi:hypothetical protein